MRRSPNDSAHAAFRSVLWPDANLESISVDYDTIELALTESTGRQVRVLCAGHIGLTIVGFWDEMIVERAEVLDDDPAIDKCVRNIYDRHSGTVLDTGCPPRNTKEWALLRIRLIDGLAIDVVATQFSTLVEP